MLQDSTRHVCMLSVWNTASLQRALLCCDVHTLVVNVIPLEVTVVLWCCTQIACIVVPDLACFATLLNALEVHVNYSCASTVQLSFHLHHCMSQGLQPWWCKRKQSVASCAVSSNTRAVSLSAHMWLRTLYIVLLHDDEACLYTFSYISKQYKQV